MKNSTRKTNPVTGEEHLIDTATGEETTPEKTEEEIREEKFNDYSYNNPESPDMFINEFCDDYDRETIVTALYTHYMSDRLANGCYELFQDWVKLNNENIKLRKQLEQSMKQTDRLLAVVKDYEDLNK